MSQSTDILGTNVTELERDLLDVYERLKRLAGRSDAPPCVRANARFALAVVWQSVNDLDLAKDSPGELDELGV